MNKTRINNLIQLGMWIFAFVGLIIIILIPKESEKLLNNLYYAFIILLLIIPLILCGYNALNFALNGIEKKEAYVILPLIGLNLFTLLSLIYFIGSVTTKGKIYMVLGMLGCFLIGLGSAYYLMKVKKYNNRHHVLILIANFIFYLAYFGLGVYVSYYYSLNW